MPLGFDWKVVAAVGLPGVVIAIFAVLIKAFDLPLGNLTGNWLPVFLLTLLAMFSLVIFYALKRWSPETTIRADLKRFTKRLKQQRKLSKRYRRDLDQIETNMASEDKMMSKKFGMISARPSEYLVVTRRDGGMDDNKSGVGRGFFMVPWKSNRKFAVIPMTVKSIEYSTSVTTTDDVEVVIKGILSYRIAHPNRIFDKVNFNNREAGGGSSRCPRLVNM
jgi:hypothetical protein